MKSTTYFFAIAIVSALIASPSHAAGPFGLFSKSLCGSTSCDGCDSACSCDSTCGDSTCSCGDSACGSNSACDAAASCNCEKDCVSGCVSRGLSKTCPVRGLLSDPCKRTYVSMFAGWNFLHDYNGENTSIPVTPVPVTLHGEFNDGWAIGGALGRELCHSVRGETELAFRDNTGAEWSVSGTTGPFDGHANVYSSMTNLYYDLDGFGALKPYVGGGIGMAIVDAEFQTSMTTIQVEDEAFAYQAITGVSTEVRSNAELFVEYRYFGFGDVDIVNAGTGTVLEKSDFDVENVFIGLRFYR